MTWLSRLLPQTSSRQLRSTPLHRTTKQRRRLMTLENLEQRVVLSDVSAVYAAGVLTITSDIGATKPGPPAIFGNAFNITENAAGGTVTVSSASLNTTINTFSNITYTTPGPVSSIFVTINSTSPSNSETVTLTDAGNQTVQDVNFTVNTANLTLKVNGVDNSGPLNVKETGQAGLTATIDNSHFSAVTITQDPQCCVGNVEFGNTVVDGKVLVSLGNAAASNITVQGGSHLGSTTFIQGSGAGDVVNVVNSYVQDLTVTQGAGAGDSINVDTVKISAVGKGVITSQGNGAGDKTTINNVTLDLSGPPNNTTQPPFSAVPSIKVSQGTGDKDVASVTNSSVTGDITITQLGNVGSTQDTATISNSSAGVVADLTILGMGKVQLNGNVSITQANGFKDTATITGVTANVVNIKQGNGGQDTASVTNSTVNGSVTVVQGDGSVVPVTTPPTPTGGDTATVSNVDGTIVDPVKGTALTGGISITQSFAGSAFGNNATATISNADAVGGASITQWTGSGLTATINNVDPTDITINQPGNGANSTATITNSAATQDLKINQGGGANDTATISNSTAARDALITQGDGAKDTATINNVKVGRAISIGQGLGAGDTATVNNSSATTPGSPTAANANNNITIGQGNGVGDTATVSNSRADGNISVTQGDGSLDTITISNSTAGFVIPIAPGIVFDWQGNVTTVQGNGNGDVANFTGLTVNNISATQGNNVFDPLNCAPGTYDEVHVNGSTVTSDITILQGGPNALGNYFATIGDVANVTAGGNTEILQNGTGNVVLLGSASTSFTTNYLDVFTGFGFSFVMATKTKVVIGAQGLFGIYTINTSGPGLGDTYVNGGGNSGVTVDPNFNM